MDNSVASGRCDTASVLAVIVAMQQNLAEIVSQIKKQMEKSRSRAEYTVSGSVDLLQRIEGHARKTEAAAIPETGDAGVRDANKHCCEVVQLASVKAARKAAANK